MSLLRLLHLASPALPIGGFHFSQGLEYAVERAWVHDEASAADWIEGLAECAIGRLDLPVLARVFDACRAQDDEAVRRWNAFLLASRETAELRAEDVHMGAALTKVIAEHGIHFTRLKIERPVYATVFAFACYEWSAERTDVLTTYVWTWAENQVLAAIKLVPLGQSAGQRILHRLTSVLPGIVSSASALEEEEIGICALMQGVASARHETQYTRLFRS
jgi:urease accessory protein